MRRVLALQVGVAWLAVWLGGASLPAAAQEQPAAETNAAPAAAAEPAVAPTPPPPTLPPLPIPTPEIPARAEQVRQTLRAVAAEVVPDAGVLRIETELPKRAGLLEAKGAETTAQLEAGAASDVLTDLESAWSSRGQELASWRRTLTKRATALETRQAELKTLAARWTATLEEVQEPGAPAALIEGVERVIGEIKASQRELKERRSKVLTLQNRVAQAEELVAQALDRVRAERTALRGRLLERDRPPLWAVLSGAAAEEPVATRFRSALLRDLDALGLYFSRRGPSLIGHGLLFAVVLVYGLSLRRRRTRWRAEDARQRFAGLVSRRPVSLALLVALVATPWIHPGAPAALADLAGLALLVPVLRLLPDVLGGAGGRAIPVLAGFFLVDRVRDVIEGLPVVERGVFLLEIAAAAGLVVWALRPARLAGLPAGALPPRWLGSGLRAAFPLLLAALFANVVGYGALSRALGGGVLNAAYLAVLLYGGARMASLLLSLVIHTWPVRTVRSIASQGPRLEALGEQLFPWAAGFLWLLFSLQAFGIREPVMEAAGRIIETPFTAGTIALSLGDLLAFVITVVTAFLLAGAIRVVLQEDVFSRLRLGRGVPNAISTSARYLVLLLGFFLAIGAAGVDFGRFTILAGAFGVGIGFGLQNVVNNFVSGLILLFERPVQIGDAVEMGTLFGEVKRIGIRSSTIRTWQGAEVIVPNSTLISDSVINWTLSDRQRRIEIRVGVSYGSEPQQVAQILVEAVRSHPAILAEPAPQVLFLGFGESSLDFEARGWTADFQTYVRTRSDITYRIHADLRAAGIEIPFPQRDVHVRDLPETASVAPGAPE